MISVWYHVWDVLYKINHFCDGSLSTYIFARASLFDPLFFPLWYHLLDPKGLIKHFRVDGTNFHNSSLFWGVLTRVEAWLVGGIVDCMLYV